MRPLGHGAMAEVLLGHVKGPRGFSRYLAIKRLHPDLANDEAVIEMFIDEARICSTLSHENIAQVLDFGEANSSYYIAMEYVKGRSLREILDASDHTIGENIAAYTVSKICAALDYAHNMNDAEGKSLSIVHRDVKPSNVLVSQDGQIKLIDFGVAKAAQRLHQTVGLVLKGSYAYMSPEQANAEYVDFRSDIFSTGTMLYELLYGENPFIGASGIDTLERVRNVRLVPLDEAVPGISPELARICQYAMAPKRHQRYRSAGDMQADLERFCQQQRFVSNDFRQWAVAQKAPKEEVKKRKTLEISEEAIEASTKAGRRAAIDRSPSDPSAELRTTIKGESSSKGRELTELLDNKPEPYAEKQQYEEEQDTFDRAKGLPEAAAGAIDASNHNERQSYRGDPSEVRTVERQRAEVKPQIAPAPTMLPRDAFNLESMDSPQRQPAHGSQPRSRAGSQPHGHGSRSQPRAAGSRPHGSQPHGAGSQPHGARPSDSSPGQGIIDRLGAARHGQPVPAHRTGPRRRPPSSGQPLSGERAGIREAPTMPSQHIHGLRSGTAEVNGPEERYSSLTVVLITLAFTLFIVAAGVILWLI